MANYNDILAKASKLAQIKSGNSIYSVYAGQRTQGIRYVVGLLDTRVGLPVYIFKAAQVAGLELGLAAFKEAMKRVPLDTGELARSGRLTVNNVVYARGTAPNPAVNETGVEELDERKKSLVPTSEDAINLAKGTLNIRMHFARLDTKTRSYDVAWVVHEDLNPHGGPHPAASKPGRGPKFAEGPMNEIIIPQLRARIEEKVLLALKTLKIK